MVDLSLEAINHSGPAANTVLVEEMTHEHGVREVRIRDVYYPGI